MTDRERALRCCCISGSKLMAKMAEMERKGKRGGKRKDRQTDRQTD
jgi:hypothetical protein